MKKGAKEPPPEVEKSLQKKIIKFSEVI